MFDRISNPDISPSSQAQLVGRSAAEIPASNNRLDQSCERIVRNRRRNALSQRHALVAVLLLVLAAMPLATRAASDCTWASHCKTCWGSGTSNCMSCDTDQNYILSNFACVLANPDPPNMAVGNTEQNACDDGYLLDIRDMRCKRTINDIDNPCLPGTYNASPGALSDSSCQVCPAGSACETHALAGGNTCEAGFYCTTASTLISPVKEYANDLVGSDLNTDEAYFSGDSLPLTSPIGGVTNWWEAFTEQYVLDAFGDPTSTVSSRTNNGDVCQKGNYCGLAAVAMTTCQRGFYCPDPWQKAHDATLTCTEGFYCSSGAYSATPGNTYPSVVRTDGATGGRCATGKYCIAGQQELSCSPGTFNPNEMGIESDDCKECPDGKYCPNDAMDSNIEQATYDCDAGYYCGQSATTAKQNACGYDEFCVQGSKWPVQCEPEDYTDGQIKATCIDCPDGKRCKEGTASGCDKGTYCIDNTISRCEPGTYGTASAASTQSNGCDDCPAGKACTQAGGDFYCAAGWLCEGKTSFEKPNLSSDGGQVCSPGNYCASGSSSALTTSQEQCSLGRYCPTWAASGAAGQCWAGSYCPLGSSKPSPALCSPGKYCPLGTAAELECPAGTYNEGSGASKQDDCKDCPDGVACNLPGLAIAPIFISVDGTKTDVCSVTNPDFATECDATSKIVPCPLGFYCELATIDTQDTNSAATTAFAKQCPKGYKCAGTRTFELCLAGTYQNEVEQAVCKNCGVEWISGGSSYIAASLTQNQGQYCDGSDKTSEGSICPQGRYCPLGTKHGDEKPCPVGTYGATSGLYAVGDCTDCDKGFYCQFKGQTSSSTPLAKGYHGNGATGLMKPDPFLCPQTAYCEAGSELPTACPAGTWTPGIGSQAITDCIPCERGTWCNFVNMWLDMEFIAWASNNPDFSLDLVKSNFNGVNKLNYFGDCQAGWICLEGAKTSTPVTSDEGYECPEGHYCQPGFVIERKCLPGTYNPSTQQSSCANCPPGFYCPDYGMIIGLECEAGSYCPGTTDHLISPTPCPAGTFGAPSGSDEDTDCLLCTQGDYCDTPGQIQTSGNCAAGFICEEENNARPGPYVTTHDAILKTSGKCNVGYYCTIGAAAQEICPVKLYAEQLQHSECLTCPPGSYCSGGADSGVCKEGYYCEESSGLMDYENDIKVFICPINHFCIQGSGQPQKCPDGQKQPDEGQTSCDPCTVGSVCKNGGQETSCPPYHYCDGNTTYPYGQLCELGFYGEPGSVGQGYSTETNCTACTQGNFCTAGQVVGKCAAGYICLEEAGSHTPNSTELAAKAYPCPLGFYCEEGVELPERCPGATFTFEQAAKQESECTICQSGFYCPNNETYTTPLACPQGTYCGFGKFNPRICPRGTYQPYTTKGYLSDCQPCEAGYSCEAEGIGNLLSTGDQYICPLGHYCPEGINVKPVPCIAGSYLDDLIESSQSLSFEETFMGAPSLADDISDCNFCPRGYICREGTPNRYQEPCPAKFLCPAGSGYPILCPPGWYCEGTGNGLVESAECPEGSYCPAGTDIPFPCGPKQVCPKKSSSPETRGKTPEDCEPGTYLNVDRCAICEPGYVCDSNTSQKYPLYAKTEGGYECPPGNYCPGGTVRGEGIGTTTGTIQKCPRGTHRLNPKGKSLEDCAICPEGSSQNKEGQSVCILCGRGSVANDDQQSCSCIGSFRTWQVITNSCVCQSGYQEPVITESEQTTTQNLDCRPVLKPECLDDEFQDASTKCVKKSICEGADYCDGAGGVYDEELDGCFCNDVEEDPDFYCDDSCKFAVLKAYFTKDDQVELQAGGISQKFPLIAFGEAFLLDGLSCEIDRCPITSQKLVDGKMVSSNEASKDFVNFWRENVSPGYVSPYPEERRRLAEHRRRLEVEPYYFSQQEKLYLKQFKVEEVDNSFFTFYEDGDAVTSWNTNDLQRYYSLSTANKWRNNNFQTTIGGTVPGSSTDLIDDIEEALQPSMELADDDDDDAFAVEDDEEQVEAAISSNSQYMEQTIQCIEPGDGVSFEVGGNSYPVYIQDSKYNTDQNYDYGAFSVLKTKLTGAKLAISSFLVTFPDKGVFTFGDNETPFTMQTLVLATKDKAGLCGGQTQFPLTSANMLKLGITKSTPLMRNFDFALYFIPPFFIVVAFLCCGLSGWVESRIEKAEEERRMRREKASATLKKYFKKKHDRFDKVNYLGDMYKLIQQTLKEIKDEIAKNQRLTEEENRDNMNKMLKDKYSVIKDLAKSGSDKDITVIQQKVSSMLNNLRFSDGRSLQEVMETMKIQEQIEAEEAQLRAMEEKEQQDKEDRNGHSSDSFVSEQLSGSDNESDSMLSKSSKTGSSASKDADRAKDEDQFDELFKANGDLADDMLAHKQALRKKREEFVASLDENLSPKMKEEMLRAFDNQMTILAGNIQKEQQDQDARLQAKLNARKRNLKKISVEAGKEVQDKQLVVTEIQDRIDALIVEKEQIEEKGVNTKALKAEREVEYQERMTNLDKEQNDKIALLREGYLAKIKAAKNPQEKDKLLEEMGKRLKNVEGNLIEEKKRQETQLQKMLKARQKKNMKTHVKGMSKEVDELEDQIEKLKVNMESDKAQIYAEKGSANGLLDHDVNVKKQKIANSLDNNFKGLDNELTQVEKDDIEIHRTQLQMEKEKELNSAEAEIDEEVNKSHKSRELEEQKELLRKRLEVGQTDPNEKQQLMNQLNELESSLSAQMHQDRQSQDRNLDEKRKKRAELLALKKMQIEADQIDELNKKDVETMNNKFLGQMEAMDKHTEKELEREVRTILTRVGPGKEQALIIVNEANDDLLARKLKILMSKQFSDLTKYLGSMQNKLMMEHMIRARKQEMKFERDKEAAIQGGMTENDLADKIQMLQAERDLEIQLSEQKLNRDREEREQQVREGQEEKFCEEKKELIQRQSGTKARKIKQTMDKMPDNETVQEVGAKLLKRIDQSVEDEMSEADTIKDLNLERARMKIVAENEKQIDDMKNSLNEAMVKEEKKLDDQMNQRRDQILTLKRANLEERLKMAGDMTAEQIKELRAQYEREYNNLEKVISEEKTKQLTNMRGAMLSRRIAKERKRRLLIEEEEAARSRAQVQKMTSGLASAFRKMIAGRMGGMSNLNKATVLVDGDDRLRARLAAWQRQVDEAKGYRGGDEGEIWTIQAARELEKAAKAEARRLKELAKAEKDKKIDFTVQELYKRIMRVQKLAEVLESSGVEIDKNLKSNIVNIQKIMTEDSTKGDFGRSYDAKSHIKKSRTGTRQ